MISFDEWWETNEGPFDSGAEREKEYWATKRGWEGGFQAAVIRCGRDNYDMSDLVDMMERILERKNK